MREEGIVRLKPNDLNKNSQTYITNKLLYDALAIEVKANAKQNTLDIGCGNMPYKKFFQDQGCNYIGCDVVQSSDNQVDVICEAGALSFFDNEFDTAFSTQVLEHVDDPYKMLTEAYRVLKSEGTLILSAPFVWELHEEPYDFFRFTKYGLKNMLEKAGFTEIDIKPNGGKWAAIFQMNINMVYSTFKRKGIFTKAMKFLFINCHFTAFLNRIAISLDKKYFDPLLTLNYVLVARKKR